MRLAAAANNAFQQASLLTTSSAQHITLPHARIGAGLVLSRERLFFLSRKMGIICTILEVLQISFIEIIYFVDGCTCIVKCWYKMSNY